MLQARDEGSKRFQLFQQLIGTLIFKMPNRALLVSGNQDEKIKTEKKKSHGFKGTVRTIQHLLTDRKVVRSSDSSGWQVRGGAAAQPRWHLARAGPHPGPAGSFHLCRLSSARRNMK